MVSCRNRPEFENLDNAKEFVLSKLKENYGIDFVFKESRKGGDACESFERYLNEQDFETLMYIYVKDGLSDDEYVDIIKLIIASIYSEHDEYNITLTVRKDDNFKDTDGTIGSYLFFQDMNQHPNLTPEHFTSESILWDISGQRFYNSH